MPTLHVENTVRDFDSWKVAFDKFDRLRAQQGVRRYRLLRSVERPDRVAIDLEFDTLEEATAFRGTLLRIWATPQSQRELVDHAAPEVLDTVEDRSPTA